LIVFRICKVKVVVDDGSVGRDAIDVDQLQNLQELVLESLPVVAVLVNFEHAFESVLQLGREKLTDLDEAVTLDAQFVCQLVANENPTVHCGCRVPDTAQGDPCVVPQR